MNPILKATKILIKKYLVLIAFSFLFSMLSAQPPESFPRTFVGAYLGPNLSGFTGHYVGNIPGQTGKIRIRTQYGFYGKIFIKRDYSVFTAIELVLDGALTKDKDSSSATVTVSYIAKTNLSTFVNSSLVCFYSKRISRLSYWPTVRFYFIGK